MGVMQQLIQILTGPFRTSRGNSGISVIKPKIIASDTLKKAL